MPQSAWDQIPDAAPTVSAPPTLGAKSASLWDRVPDLVIAGAKRIIPTALRIGGAVIGGALGAPGGVPGIMVGGAVGSGLGETAAEGVETWAGERSGLNPTQIAVQSALGAVPVVGRAGSVGRTVLSRGAQGAVLGGVSDVATKLAEGETPTVGGALAGAALGGALGAGAGTLEARSLAKTAKIAQLEQDVAGEIRQHELTLQSMRDLADRKNLSTAASGGRAASWDDIPPAAVEPPAPAAAAAEPPIVTPPAPTVTPPAPVEAPAPLVAEDLTKRVYPPPPPITSSVTDAARLATARGEEIPALKPLPEDRKFRMMASLPEGDHEEMLQLLARNGAFEAQRRGVVPDARVQALAAHIQVDRTRVAPRRTILPAEETLALAHAVVTTNDEARILAAKILSADATPKDLLRMAQLRQEQAALAATAYGNAAEQGRALRIQKQIGQILNANDDQALLAALKNPDIRDLPDFAKVWAALPDNDQAKFDWIRKQSRLSVGQMAQSVYYANILSGLKTTLRNVFGSGSNAVFNQMSQLPSVGYDVARSKLTGQARTMYLGEIPAGAGGTLVGLKQGLDEALFAMKHGYTRSALSSFDAPRAELPGGTKNPFNLPGRFLEAQDQFMGGTIYQIELQKRLWAKARTEVGTDPDLIATKLAEWKLAPPTDIVQQARAAAEHALFRENPGTIVNSLTRETGTWGAVGKAVRFVVPFMKVPANIFRQSLEASPAAFVTPQFRAAVRAGGREQSEAMGRALLGTAGLATLAYWASQGKISGTGPSDPEQRAALMESGWRPHSIKIGNRWIDYTIPFQTIAIPLSAMATAWEQYHQDPGGNPPERLAEQVAAAVPATLLDQSFLSGLSDFNAAMTDPGRYLTNYVGRWATGWVPFSGLSRNVTQAVDPLVREVRAKTISDSVSQNVRAIVPGLSTTVAPKLDRFGTPVRRDTGSSITPVGVSPAPTDPLVKALSALGVDSIATPTREIQIRPGDPASKVTLTTAERRQMGQDLRAALESVVLRPAFERLDPAAARERISRVVQDARTRSIATIRAARRREGGTR